MLDPNAQVTLTARHEKRDQRLPFLTCTNPKFISMLSKSSDKVVVLVRNTESNES